MKTAESRRDVLPCLKTGLKFADLLRVYIDNNLLYKWIHVCVALCTSACVCSCRCVFRMSSASESFRPASEQFNNTLLPCCTQLRTWEQIYSEVTWGTSFFTNIRLNTNIKLLLKKQRKCHLVHEAFTRRQQLLPLVGQEGLAGLVHSTLSLISQHALLPCHLPAYKEGEIMLSALKPVRALWVKQTEQPEYWTFLQYFKMFPTCWCWQ